MTFFRYIIILVLLIFNVSISRIYAQDNKSIRHKIDSIAEFVPALNEKVDFTVNNLPLHEFIRGIANESGLNVNLDTGLDQLVTNNFTDVLVKDLIVFIGTNYDVDINIVGNILNIRRKADPIIPSQTSVVVVYDSEKELLSLEAVGTPLSEVVKEITRQSNINVIATSRAKGTLINSFVKEMPLSSALRKLAIENELIISETKEGLLVLDSEVKVNSLDARDAQYSNSGSRNKPKTGRSNTSRTSSYCNIVFNHNDSIDISAENAPITEFISKLFSPLNYSYHFIGEINEAVSMEIVGGKLENILQVLFAGLPVAIRKVGDTYWIGARKVVELNEVELVQMRYRSIDSLQYIIPTNLKADTEIIEYPDMNSLILAGPSDRIKDLTDFLKKVDVLIPVILIEVIIVDNNDSKQLTTGITAGLSEEAVSTQGSILPSVDLTLSSNSINRVVDGFNGLGWVNLGKVNSNFYMTLKALDENGYVNIKSTPQLATMNGHKASMSIGRTEYYKEELNTLYGSVTSSSQTTTTYKPVEAELKIDIKPIVSGSQDVTLNISVEQSDFTSRIETNAPPGKVSRKFESLIRVKDQEMILLGGLEEVEKKDTRSGLPLLSRIPLLNWLFSSKSKVSSDGKLNVFIKPTILN